MNTTCRAGFNEIQGALHSAQERAEDALSRASAELDATSDERHNWRAEVIRLRELLWNLCPAGKPECPHCHGSQCLADPRGQTQACGACHGKGWQAIGSLEREGLAPLAQADCFDGWVPQYPGAV